MVAIEPGGPQIGSVDTAKVTYTRVNPSSWGLTTSPYKYEPPINSPAELKVHLEPSERPGDVVAVERHSACRALTVGDLVARTDVVAEGLAAAGAAADRPIVVWLPNRLEWIEVIAAAARLGALVVAVNPRYSGELGD